MHCPACQHENPEDSRFCGECGASVPGAVAQLALRELAADIARTRFGMTAQAVRVAAATERSV